MNKKDKTNNKLQLLMLTQTNGRALKWYKTSEKSKMKCKIQKLRIGIMYNFKDKLSTE